MTLNVIAVVSYASVDHKAGGEALDTNEVVFYTTMRTCTSVAHLNDIKYPMSHQSELQ